MLNIIQGTTAQAVKAVIYGPEGIGKTTLASKFPDPLFIDIEGSTKYLNVKRVSPDPQTWEELLSYIKEVSGSPDVCKSLVIDTADWAERLCVSYILRKNNWTTIEAPGFGRGYREVNEEFGKLLDLLSLVADKGINVVVTAHSRISKFEQPDEMGTYDRYTLKLFDSPKSSNAALLKEWADLLLFCNYKTFVVKPDDRVGGSQKLRGGKRVMYANHTPAFDAKNRFNLPDEMEMDIKSLSGVFPSNDTTVETVEAVVIEETSTPFKDQLIELLKTNEINPSYLETYCAEKEYCSAGTSIDSYPEDFCSYLVNNWSEIEPEINIPIL